MTELLGWTFDRSADFPKCHRFTFGQRLDGLTLDGLLLLTRAIFSSRDSKAPLLIEFNLLLEQLRVLWRLAHNRQWISQQQLVFVTGKIDELGRMAGGWLRQLETTARKSRP